MTNKKHEPRKLKIWEAGALSVGFMAPLLAMSLNGIGVAQLTGKSVPLVFTIAFIGVIFVAYGFVRLTRRFNHAGSVYALAGRTIGPRTGFFGGFTLLGTYLFFAACTLAASGVFFQAWVAESGWADFNPPWAVIVLLVAVLTVLANLRESRFVARILVAIGGLGVVLMLVLGIVILVRVGLGTAPVEAQIDFSVFSLGDNTVGSIMTATVFAFLSWAGFEACASLGEETTNPSKAIPAALGGAVVLCGIIYVFVMFAQTIGFGTGPEGVEAFSSSESSLTQLATMYIGKEFSVVLAAAAFIVAFASTLSSTAAASRLIFALARDGFGPRKLGIANPATQIPRNAVVTVGVLITIMALALWFYDVSAFDAYYWYATIAVLCLLVAYCTTTVGVIYYIFSGRGSIPKWELVIPVLGILYLLFVFIVQSTGQEPPFSYFPWIAGAWCLIGVLIALFAPSLTKQIGQRLLSEDIDQESGRTDAVSPEQGENS